MAGFGGAPPGGPVPRPVYVPPPQYAVPPSSGGPGKVIAIVAAVAVVLILGMVGVGVVAYLGVRGGDGVGGGIGGGDVVPLALNVPAVGVLTGSSQRQVYELAIAEPTLVTIAVDGSFDNYLELYRDGEPTPFLEDDDSGPGLNAQLSTHLTPGVYFVLVRPFSSATGTFTVTASGTPVGGHGLLHPPMPDGTLPSSGTIAVQSLTGLVTGTSGGAPAAPGSSCSVLVEPASGMFNCRVRVICGGAVIYGAGSSGYNHCTAAGGLVEAHDRGGTSSDGDPRMDISTGARQVVVSDGDGPASWTVTVQLTPPGGEGPPTSI